INTPSDANVVHWKITEPTNGPASVYAPYPYSDGDTFSPSVGIHKAISTSDPKRRIPPGASRYTDTSISTCPEMICRAFRVPSYRSTLPLSSLENHLGGDVVDFSRIPANPSHGPCRNMFVL
ncbi:hypothetical protein, partial [Burkholderia pseudomallei]|uniref:hypothetical protein n=1 Tax=Burkholderia pseudomallei TaxID=28450 RepID=UPI001AD78C95